MAKQKDLTGKTLLIIHPDLNKGNQALIKVTDHDISTNTLLIHNAVDIKTLDKINFRFGGRTLNFSYTTSSNIVK